MQFHDLFRGYTGSHGVSVATDELDNRGKKKHRHFTKPGAPSELEWKRHLSGEGPGLGVIPLLDDNRNVYWGAIDIDKYPLDHNKLAEDAKDLPLVICLSKSRGAHLYLFCSEPTPAKLVIETLTRWAEQLGWAGSEIFPKQHSRLVGKEDQGNWINLPYFGDTRRCWYHGEEVSLETFLVVAEQRLATEAKLRRKIESERKTMKGDEGMFADGPPCLQKIFKEGLAEGGRNNTLFNVGVYLKSKEPEDWAKLFSAFNRDNVPNPLEENEIEDSTKTLERKAYNYTCSKHPLVNNCNRPLCTKRKFGVAQGTSAAEELNITLSGLTKIDTTTPRWFINIDGVRAEIPDTKVLMDQKQFGLLVIERVHKVMAPIKPLRWSAEIQRLLNNVEVVEAPLEASPEGQFIAHLANFIEKRGQSETRDSLVSGRVWTCLKCRRAYFRSQDLVQYLRREGFRDINSTQMYSLLHLAGVEKGRFNVKGSTISYWSIPMPSLQSEPFDVPSFSQEQKKEENNAQRPAGHSYESAF